MYNIFINQWDGSYNLLGLSKEQLNKVVEAYQTGKKTFALSGQKYTLNKVNTFLIFTHTHKLDPEVCKKRIIESGNAEQSYFGFKFLSPEHLQQMGENITDEIIGDIEFGELKVVNEKMPIDDYVDFNRIAELKKLVSGYDFKKLTRLCEELNDNYSRQNFYSVGMLVRAIIDHIPPIFEKNSFKEVANNYSEGGKSFSKNMKHLENSLRNISDGFLHNHIRKKESLPNEIQVNFSQDLDVLLAEIIRIS